MYQYYLEVEEAQIQIALHEYGTTDISYDEAKYLQKVYDIKEVLKLYDEYKDWNEAIEAYKRKNL